MHAALVVARAAQFWAVAILFGGGGLALLLGHVLQHGQALLRAAAVVAAASGLAWLGVTLVGMTDDVGSLWTAGDWTGFLAAPFGPPWAVRVALFVGCAFVATWPRPMSATAVGFGLALDQAWLGHAAAAATRATAVTMIASYWVHVLAAFAWVGALTMLCLLLRGRGAVLREALAVFSTVGIAIVAAILASGCLNAAFHLTALRDVFTTTYGRLVGLKLLLFSSMAVFAWWNRSHRGQTDASIRRLGFGVGLETVLGLATLVVAAVLGIAEPPG